MSQSNKEGIALYLKLWRAVILLEASAASCVCLMLDWLAEAHQACAEMAKTSSAM